MLGELTNSIKMIRAGLFIVIVCGIIPSRGDDEYPPREVKEHLAGLHDICVKKLGIPGDITKNFDISNKSPEMMCYLKCIMREGNWAKEDETVDFDGIMKDPHPDMKLILENMLSKCRNTPPGTQDCETTYNFFVCVHAADPEHFYLPQ